MAFIKKHMLLGITIALLAAAATMVTPLHKEQIRQDLISDPVRGASPDIVLLTTALGAFRGVIINVIWIRMERLKQEGKFFELAQLADLACRLAPRFPRVWDYNAWNLAYNIVPSIPDLEERWPWVRQGIALLRDQGIPNNPEEPELYFSLAWKHMHKIGGDIDDAHFYYKRNFGLEMHEVFGGRGSREFIEALAETPTRRATLLRNEEVRDFYNRLLEKGFDPLRTEDGEMQFFIYLRSPDSIPDGARELMQATRHRNVVDEIATFARAYRLRNELRMRPEIMLDLMDEYGPLDWRNPFSHAIYWATLGRRVAAAYRDRSRLRRMRAAGMSIEEIVEADPDEWAESDEWGTQRYEDIHYDRIVYNSLATLVTTGRLHFDRRGELLLEHDFRSDEPRIRLAPDYRFAEPMVDTFERMMDKYDADAGFMGGIRSAYENFLRRATVEFYYMGDLSKSRRYYEKLGERFPKRAHDVPHERFVTAELEDFVDNARARDMRNLVSGLLRQSFFNLAVGAEDRSESLEGRARRLARMWNEKHARTEESQMRVSVDFSALRDSALADIFAGFAGFPEDLIALLREQLPAEDVERAEAIAEEMLEED